jgi:methylisocitrate lyase
MRLGFKAIATTSAGFAWSLARRDHGVTIDIVLSHLRAISARVEIPVNADFEGGYAVRPEDVARNVTAAASTGIAGLSIEDSTGDANQPLYDFPLAVERVHAAREAIGARGTGVLLTGRSEGFLVGRPDLNETIRRLNAYIEAGADCVFAPGLRTVPEIRTVVESVAPTPVNVLVSSDFTTVRELEQVGVRRISVGGALARAAWTGFLQAAGEIAERGTFSALGQAVARPQINELF